MIFFLLPEIRYGIGLLEHVEEPACIVTSHRHEAVGIIRDQGYEVICLEEEGLEPVYQAPQMLELELVRSKIMQLPYNERKILTFKISPRLEVLARSLQATILMPPSELNRFWENKDKGMAELTAIGVPTKSSVSAAFGSLSYHSLAKDWQYSKLVVQKPRGMAGSTTYFVDSEQEWSDLEPILHNTLVKVTPYLEGKTFTVNCLLNDTGVYHSYPMFQITGDRRFTRYPGGTCGVDMTGGRSFSNEFLQKLTQIVHKIGAALKKTNFWGWFGLDFIVTNTDEIIIIEINPRFTASLSIFSQYQSVMFSASFWSGYIDRKQPLPNVVKPLPLTTLILRNTAEETKVVENDLSCGLYEHTNNQLHLNSSTIFISDLCSLPSKLPQYLVVSKAKGTAINMDGEYATIVTPRSAIDQNGNVDAELAKVADLVSMTLFKKQ